MKNSDFFNIQTSSSRIKASIVAEYFPQYCKIILKKPQNQIRYLDLFSGPGIYADGSHSTPLLLANYCAADPLLNSKVFLLFNDNKFSKDLEVNFTKQFPSGTFNYEPKFGNKTVGEDEKINEYLVKNFGKPNPHPTLLFFDPWGYKGIDTIVLSKFLENWGNELFLFVNIKRINAAIDNNKFDELMKSLFPTTIEKIRKDKKYGATVYERLNLIMDNLAQEFKSLVNGNLYHCAFKFKEEDSIATSHFIIHFTKHSKGYELVKQVYYDFDNIGATLEKDGDYTFDSKKMDVPSSYSLNFGDENINALSKQLEIHFKGKTISAKKLFDEHHITTKFCGSHYVKTLRQMVEDNKISAKFIDEKKHKKSVLINENCILTFI